MLELIFLLIVAAVCGSLGRAIAGYSHGGCLVSIVLGFIGALFGKWLARLLDLPFVFPLEMRGQEFPVLWSIIGSALFVALVSFVSGKRRR